MDVRGLAFVSWIWFLGGSFLYDLPETKSGKMRPIRTICLGRRSVLCGGRIHTITENPTLN